jgi:hypothetical protein
MSAIRMVLATSIALSALLPACSASTGPDSVAESAGAGASSGSGDPAGAGGSSSSASSGSGATGTCTDIMNPDSGLLDTGPEPVTDDPGAPADAVAGQSVQSGAWSDPATWLGGAVPSSATLAIVSTGHTVDIDVDAGVAGLLVQEGGLLRFDHQASATLESSENVLVQGTLEMRPASTSFQHTVRFVGVDEDAMVGGGMDPLPSDVGLWVMGAGKLSIRGASKTPWTRLQGSASPGDTVLTLQAAPVGWEVGDEIVVVPTETPGDDASWNDATGQVDDPFHAKFERRLITAVDGAAVTLDAPLEYAHDEVVASDGVKKWRAEVANLSRNTHVEGTPGGRAHVFIRSTVPQAIAYLEGRFLGPRKVQPGHDRPQLITGRYAMHFHHCMDGSRGSWVHGTAFHDNGNRVFVPHMSNGVTMRNNVSFHSLEAAFWWDFQENSHDILYENNLLALVSMNGVGGAQTGMLLNMGDGNVARDNVAVYASGGDVHNRGAFEWNTDSEGIWIFENNLAHSTAAGIFVWQNTSFNHVISNFESYNNRLGIMHGAYGNSYTYRHGYHYNSPVEVEATSGNSNGVVFDSITFDAAGAEYAVLFHDSPIPSGESNKWLRCDFRAYTKAGLRLYSSMPFSNVEKQFKYGDLIACSFEGEAFVLDQSGAPAPGVSETFPLMDGSRIRVQPAEGQSYQGEIVAGSPVMSDIEPFAPSAWGSGDGLLGEYYVGSNFDEPAFTRVDSVIMFQQWSKDPKMSPFGVHHLVSGDAYSIRWTGDIEPQHTGPHTFSIQGAGGTRLWIDGVQVIDSWADKSDNEVVVTSTPVELVQGTKVAIQLEHSNEGGARACMLYWTPPERPAVFLPQTQTYSGVEIAECAE